MNLVRKVWDRIALKTVDALTASFSTTATYEFYRKYPRLITALGGGIATYTGESVTETSALNCSIVWCAVRVISQTVAGLPLHLMERRADGKYLAEDHPLYAVLHDEANLEMSDMELRETLTAHCLVNGNAYARIVRRSEDGPVIGVWPWKPNQVMPQRVKADNRLVYVVTEDNGPDKTWEMRDVFHLRGLGFDGVRGYSVIEKGRQSIALALVQEKFIARFFARGGRKPYHLEHPRNFKDEPEYERFRKKWEDTYGSSDDFFKAVILEGGLKLVEEGMSLEDAQFLGSRQFSVPEICRWFNITPHLVGDLSHATFTNVENLFLQSYIMTFMPWCIRWEKAIHRCLLNTKEKLKYYAKHSIAGLLRGDFESRTKGYASMLQNGIVSIDEVRDLEDWNPVPTGAGRAHHIQLNMQTLPGTGAMTAVEESARARAQVPKPAPV